MKRFAMQKLLEWKQDPDRLPLIIRGARQVGKTWLMREFGRLHFESGMCYNDKMEKRILRHMDWVDWTDSRFFSGLLPTAGKRWMAFAATAL